MAYSRAYQQVIAGRVREDEQLPFYGKNKVAVPGRVTNFVSMGGQKQPSIKADSLQFTGVGKPNNPVNPVTHLVTDNLSTGNPPSINIS